MPSTVVCQAPLSMGFPRQKFWIGLPFPSPGHLPDSGINLFLLHWQVNCLPLSHQGILYIHGHHTTSNCHCFFSPLGIWLIGCLPTTISLCQRIYCKRGGGSQERRYERIQSFRDKESLPTYFFLCMLSLCVFKKSTSFPRKEL